MAITQRHIVFVDHDPVMLRSYQQAVTPYSEYWAAYFADSAAEALLVIAQKPIDVLITDIRMPGMDGNNLLDYVSKHYPGIVRLVLTGSLDESKALITARLAHQLIVKPCDVVKLYVIIERTCQLRDLLSNPGLIRLVTGIKKIPPLPALYMRLIYELQNDEAAPKVVGEIVSQDVAMTAKILQLVNSAFFGLPAEVTSPQKAVTILGINTIKSLVLGSYIFSEYEHFGNRFVSIDDLWSHSLIVSNLAKAVGASAGLSIKEQGEAQLAGMLHDIGKLLQLSLSGFFQAVKFVDGKIDLVSEYQVLGASHAEMGAYLLGLWGLPQVVVEAVAYHHNPTALPVQKFNVLTALHIANGLYNLEKQHGSDEDYPRYLNMGYVQDCLAVDQLGSWRDQARKMIDATGD